MREYWRLCEEMHSIFVIWKCVLARRPNYSLVTYNQQRNINKLFGIICENDWFKKNLKIKKFIYFHMKEI